MRTTPTRKATLCLCSKSPIKVQAVRAALEELGYTGVELVTCEAPRGFPAQPLGEMVTSSFATKRAEFALQTLEGKTGRLFGLGIESGIFEEGGWVEYAELRLATGEDLLRERTATVPLAREDVDTALELPGGFQANTVGEAVAARLGGDPKDPISTMTRGARTRGGMIQAAVKELLRQIEDDLQSMTVDLGVGDEPRYEVDLGFMEMHLRLPIRKTGCEGTLNKKLGDGLRLAYFDCAHPALTLGAQESLARALIRKFGTEKFDVVMTPEGKARELAYEAARMLGVPLVYFRKSWRALDPIIAEEEYGSVTSGTNSLHLTFTQEPFLKGKSVLFIDDVVTTGGSMGACVQLARIAGAASVKTAAVFYETADLGRTGDGPVELAGGRKLDHYLALLPEPGIL